MELEKILTGINNKRDEMVLKKAMQNPTVMNDLMLELAQLYHFLGERVADEWLQLKQFKSNKYHEFLAKGMKPSPAEREVSFDLECIAKEAEYRRLENIDDRTKMLITACQSHLKFKGGEMMDARMNQP